MTNNYNNGNNNKLLHEVFKEFESITSKNEKVEFLRRNSSYSLKSYLAGLFSPKVKFCFNECPSYKTPDCPNGFGYTTISNAIQRVYLFEEGNPRVDPNLTNERKKELVIQVLESLDPGEAKLFEEMINKKTSIKGLTSSVVKEAFGDMI
jgi:hypothetical protein